MIEVRDGTTEEWFAEVPRISAWPGPTSTTSPAALPRRTRRSPGRVLDGESGPAADLVALNAGAAIFVGGGADDLGAGIERAREAIESGAAREVLGRLVALTGEIATD